MKKTKTEQPVKVEVKQVVVRDGIEIEQECEASKVDDQLYNVMVTKEKPLQPRPNHFLDKDYAAELELHTKYRDSKGRFAKRPTSEKELTVNDAILAGACSFEDENPFVQSKPAKPDLFEGVKEQLNVRLTLKAELEKQQEQLEAEICRQQNKLSYRIKQSLTSALTLCKSYIVEKYQVFRAKLLGK